MAASIPNTAPVAHFTPSRSRYQFILLGEQWHMCVNNLPRVAPSGVTDGNQTRNLSITNPTPCRYTTKPPIPISLKQFHVTIIRRCLTAGFKYPSSYHSTRTVPLLLHTVYTTHLSGYPGCNQTRRATLLTPNSFPAYGNSAMGPSYLIRPQR